MEGAPLPQRASDVNPLSWLTLRRRPILVLCFFQKQKMMLRWLRNPVSEQYLGFKSIARPTDHDLEHLDANLPVRYVVQDL